MKAIFYTYGKYKEIVKYSSVKGGGGGEFHPNGWCLSFLKTRHLQKKEQMLTFGDKEIMIARYAASGMTVPEIAEAMCLSPETIRWYRKRMLKKADARNFAELIARLKDENIL